MSSLWCGKICGKDFSDGSERAKGNYGGEMGDDGEDELARVK